MPHTLAIGEIKGNECATLSRGRNKERKDKDTSQLPPSRRRRGTGQNDHQLSLGSTSIGTFRPRYLLEKLGRLCLVKLFLLSLSPRDKYF